MRSAVLNVGAAQTRGVAPLYRDELPASVASTLDALLEGPDDQRIAVEGGLQRVASVILMQELFSMA